MYIFLILTRQSLGLKKTPTGYTVDSTAQRKQSTEKKIEQEIQQYN